MQYSPKLKKAAEEIKQVLKKYDIAASVVLHTPSHCEYLLEITPTYSCAWIENGNHLRFRARKQDYNGNVAMRNQKIKDTVNMLRILSDQQARHAMNLMEAADKFDKIVGAEHGDEDHTSHTTQNN